MLEIDMENLFRGFIKNYMSFGIRDNANWTKWTHRILGYYGQLGRMLGVSVEYEWNKFDLVWFWEEEDRKSKDPWLHIEHENDPDRLIKLAEKAAESYSLNVVVIGYPGSKSDEEKLIHQLKKIKSEWKEAEILAIMDTVVYEEEPIPINGYILRYAQKENMLAGCKEKAKNGTYYCYMRE